MRHLRTTIRRSRPHILSRKWIVARVLAKVYELIFDVFLPLAGQSRCGRIALGRCSVAPGAIPNRQTLRVARQRGTGAENSRQNGHLQTRGLHDQSFQRTEGLLQVIDVGRDSFDLRSCQTVRNRFHDR